MENTRVDITITTLQGEGGLSGHVLLVAGRDGVARLLVQLEGGPAVLAVGEVQRVARGAAPRRGLLRATARLLLGRLLLAVREVVVVLRPVLARPLPHPRPAPVPLPPRPAWAELYWAWPL